jgi:YYY domain-containing protein
MTDALRFWLLAEVVGLLALPVASTFFSRLPGGGLALARPLGFLLATYPVWLLASLHVLPYGPGSAWLGLLVLAALALGVTVYGRTGGRRPWYLHCDRPARDLWLAGEALFLLAFAGWTVLRSYAPDVWGTEKPMDMAFINAINRSTAMPPHDPWLSGTTINYYYYGHFIIAWLIRLGGVQPWVGFNLGVALMYALTAGAVFGVAATLYAAIRRGTPAPPVSPILPGLAAAALAMLAGNLDGALELLQKPGPLLQFDWWSPSRVIADTITEFPFFSFLLADLHAHMMATPFGLTALAFAFQLALAGPRLPQRRAGAKEVGSAWVACAGELLLAGLVAGCLYALNGWDYPTELGIGFLCLLLWASRRQEGVPAGPLAVWAGAWLLISFLLFLPFYLHFKAPEGGLGIVRQHASLVQYLHDYALIYGVAIWALAAAFSHRWRGFVIARRHAVWAGIGALTLLVLLAPAHLDGPALLLVACTFALLAATDDRLAQPTRLWWLIVGVAIGLASVGEVVYLRDAFAGSPNYRMNTIFKFGYQAWFLFAIAAGCGAFWSKRWLSPASRPVWLGGLAVLVACAGIYTVAGTYSREGGFRGGRTLDGLQWLQIQAPGDAAAIRWLNGHVQGAPTLLEAVGSDYDPAGHARVSTFTGLPAVLGWPGHEAQWAHDQGTRQQDVATLYSTTDLSVSRALLARYDVQYVFVGSLERADFPPAGLAKFGQMGTAVYSSGGTTVYRIGR